MAAATFSFSPRLRRGDTGRGGAPLGKGDGGLRKKLAGKPLHKWGVGDTPTKKDLQLFRLQIPIFFSYVNDARTILIGIQVVMPDYHGAGVARMQFLE